MWGGKPHVCPCRCSTEPIASGNLQHVVARPSPVLSKQLAYDIVKSGAPGDTDWEFVYAGELAAIMQHSVLVVRPIFIIHSHSN